MKKGSDPHYLFVNSEVVSQILAGNGIPAEHPQHEFYKDYILDKLKGTWFTSSEEGKEAILNYIPKVTSLNFRKGMLKFGQEELELPTSQVTKQELIRLYKKEAQGIYDEEAIDAVVSEFIRVLEGSITFMSSKWNEGQLDTLSDEDVEIAKEQMEDEKKLVQILRKAKTPQEKMIAIDQVINTAHLSGVYGGFLVEGVELLGVDPFFDELSNLKISSLSMRKKAQPETPQENFYEPGISDEYPKGPKKPKRRFPFYNYPPDDQGNMINADPNYSNPMEYDTLPGAPPQGPGIFGNLNMRKKYAQLVTKQELLRLYKQEAKGIYDEELEDEIISGFLVGLEEWKQGLWEASDEGDSWFEERIAIIDDLIEILQQAKTPQEKMIAIDQVINTIHSKGPYINYLVEEGDEAFLKELGNLYTPPDIESKAFLNMRKKAQIDKQMFFDFYGLSTLSDTYLEQSSYAKEYKDMIALQMKEAYVPLITEMVYKELSDNIDMLYSWKEWLSKFNVVTPMDLTLEQIKQIYKEGSWKSSYGPFGIPAGVLYGGELWGSIVESLIQLQNTTDTNQLITIIDHINDLEHNTGVVFRDIPSFSGWIEEALELKAQANLQQLISYFSSDVQKFVTEDLRMYGEETAAPERYITWKEKMEKAQDSSTPPETLAELAKDEDEDIREVVAKNPNTSPETLAELAKDKNADVRQEVAENPNTSLELLTILSKDKSEYVRQEVIKNPNTPVELLIKLSKDESNIVRGALADNPNTPPKILAALAKKGNEVVRQRVAENSNTSPETLAELAKDDYVWTRKAVAKNHSTPPETLAELAKDEDKIVRNFVMRNPNTPLEIKKQLKQITSSKLNMRKKGKGLKEYIRENIERVFIIPQQLKLRFGKVAQTEFNVGDKITFDAARYLGKGKKRAGGVLKGKGVITKKEDDTYSIKITELTEVAEDLKNIFRTELTAEFALDEIKLEKPEVEPKKEIPVEKPKPKEKIPTYELDKKPSKLPFEFEEEEISTYELVEGIKKPTEKPDEVEEEEKEKIPFWKSVVEKAWESFKRPVTKPFGSKLNMKKTASVDEHEYKWKEIHQGKVPTYTFKGFQEGLQGKKNILVDCNICKSTLMLTAKEVKVYEYKIEGLPRGWEQEVKLSAKKHKGPIISILEDIAQDVWTATDLETAKNVIITKVESSQIAEDDKRTIVDTTNKIDNLVELQKYIANSILFYEGMGTKLSMRKKAQIDKQMFFDFYGLSLLSDDYLEQNSYAKEYKDMIVLQMKEAYVPLIENAVYAQANLGSTFLEDTDKWTTLWDFDNAKDLTLEQVSQMFLEGKWSIPMKRWAQITDVLIKLKNTTDSTELYIIIDQINSLRHKYGLLLGKFDETVNWIEEALTIKAQATPEQLIPYCSTDVQKLIIEDLSIRGQMPSEIQKFPSIIERRRAAKDFETSPEVLLELAQDPDYNVRYNVATNPNTPPDALRILSESKSEKFRYVIAEHPNTPPETLTELAKDKSEIVRWTVAENPNTPPEILAELAKDEDEGVRSYVVTNPNTPLEIKEQLKQTTSLNMRKKAVSDLRVIDKVTSYFKDTDLPKTYESVYAFILERYPELSTWEIERFTEMILNIMQGPIPRLSMRRTSQQNLTLEEKSFVKDFVKHFERLHDAEYIGEELDSPTFMFDLVKHLEEDLKVPSNRSNDIALAIYDQVVDDFVDFTWLAKEEIFDIIKKAEVVVEGSPPGEGSWAVYQGNVYITYDKNKRHAIWFEELGIPSVGVEYDNIVRGYFVDNRSYIGWYGTGDYNEFYDHLGELKSTLGYPEDSEVGMIDYTTQEFQVLSMRKKVISNRSEPQVTKQELIRLYIQNAKGIYDEEAIDAVVSEFIRVLEGLIEWFAGVGELITQVENIKGLISILKRVKTPQEKMIAIDQVINTAHTSGKYIEYLIVDGDEFFLNELGNLKISSLNMRKATVPVPLRMSLDYPHSWPQKKKKKKDEKKEARYFMIKQSSLNIDLLRRLYTQQLKTPGLYDHDLLVEIQYDFLEAFHTWKEDLQKQQEKAQERLDKYTGGKSRQFGGEDLENWMYSEDWAESKISKALELEEQVDNYRSIGESLNLLIPLLEKAVTDDQIILAVDRAVNAIHYRLSESDPLILQLVSPQKVIEVKKLLDDIFNIPYYSPLHEEEQLEKELSQMGKNVEESKSLNMRKKATNVSVPTPSDSLHEQQGEQNSWHTYFQGKDRWISREPDQGFDIDFPSKERIKRSPWPFDDTTPTSPMMASLSMRKKSVLTPEDLELLYVVELQYNKAQQENDPRQFRLEEQLDRLSDIVVRELLWFISASLDSEDMELELVRLEGEDLIERYKERKRELESVTDIGSKMIAIDNVINMMHIDYPILKHLYWTHKGGAEVGLMGGPEKKEEIQARWKILEDFLEHREQLKQTAKLSMRKTAQVSLETLKQFYTDMETEHYNEKRLQYILDEWSNVLDKLTKPTGISDEELEEFEERILSHLTIDPSTSYEPYHLAMKVDGVIDFLHEGYPEFRYAFISGNEEEINNWFATSEEGRGKEASILSMRKKAQTKRTECDGIWVIWNGDVYIHFGDHLRFGGHQTWFDELGIVYETDEEFNSFTRGYYGNNEIVWYEDVGTREEFLEYLPVLLSKIGYSLDAKIYSSSDLGGKEFNVIKTSSNLKKKASRLSMRKKAVITSDMLHNFYKLELQYREEQNLLIEKRLDNLSEQIVKELLILLNELLYIEPKETEEQTEVGKNLRLRKQELENAFDIDSKMIAIDNTINTMHYDWSMIEQLRYKHKEELGSKVKEDPLERITFNESWNNVIEFLKEQGKITQEASILDYPQKYLDSAMWDLSGDLPKLKENVKGLIVERFLNYLREEGKLNNPELWCTGFYYTGSTATYRYRPTTDIDIHIKVDWEKFKKSNSDKAKDDIEEMHKELLQVFWNTLNKEVLPDTQHPLTYYVLSERENVFEMGEEAYDILNDSWIVPPHKLPENLDIDEKIELLGVQANAIMERLDEELGKTKRDFIDYKILKELLDSYEGDKKDIQKVIEEKLEDVESRLKGLQEENVKIHNERQKAFHDGQEPIEEGLSQNWAPGNIIFKLIEKYRYMDVLRKIKHIIEDDKITEDEEKQLEDLLEPKLSMRKKALIDYITRQQIRRLYKQEVKGIYDEELMDEIISGFLMTCHDLLDIYEGDQFAKDALNILQEAATKTPQEKMIAIDQVLSYAHATGTYINLLVINGTEEFFESLHNLERESLSMRKKAISDMEVPENWMVQDKTDKKLRRTNPPRHDKNDSIVEHNIDPKIDMASLNMRKKAYTLKALFEGIEFTDRYDALGISLPNPETMCRGQCEGTGWIPIHKDDMEEPFHTLWLEAEKETPTDDSYHFVKCPDCHGTGLRTNSKIASIKIKPSKKGLRKLIQMKKKGFEGQPTDKNYNSPSLLLREDQGPSYPSEPAQAEIPGTTDDDQWGESNKLKKKRPTKEKIFPDFQTTYKWPGGEVGQY